VEIERPVATSEIVPRARTSVFGILTLDAAGNPQFVATTAVPNVAKQAYGWFIWVGDSPRSVRSTETFTLARPPVRRSTIAPEPSIFSSGNEGMVITKDQTGVRTETTFTSRDGRTGLNRIESTPLDGFIWNSWEVKPGDPPGGYEISVSLSGGRKETFFFSLGEPELSDHSFESCPYMDVYVDWGWAKEVRGGDSSESDISARALTVFAETLMRDHPFALAEEPEDAYWVASVTASQNVMNPETTHRYVKVRTLAHSQGKAVRPTYFGDTNDHGFLFEVPFAEHDAYVRGLARRFADAPTRLSSLRRLDEPSAGRRSATRTDSRGVDRGNGTGSARASREAAPEAPGARGNGAADAMIEGREQTPAEFIARAQESAGRGASQRRWRPSV
jgi:hypothetical protein